MKLNFFIKKITGFLFLILAAGAIFAQSISKKQDIAVFPLSYYGWTIPEILYEGIDAEIMRNFFALERFNIIAMEHRFSALDLETFNAAIIKSRETDTPIPEEVLMGHESFTRTDWEKTVNAYYIIVPIVQSYTLKIVEEENNDDENPYGEPVFTYKVKFSVEFHIYSMQKKNKIAYFVIEEKASSKNLEEALNSAITFFGIKFERALRGIEDFRIKTGVIKTEKNNVHFELGNDIGVKKGDEYVVIGYDENNNEAETGFVVVTDTEEDFSTALTLFSNRPITIGDQLKEVPRFPVEFRIFFTGEFTLKKAGEAKSSSVFQTGLHVSHTRGFYRFRPCYAIEAGFSSAKISEGIPVSVLLGMEIWNTYLGKVQILPTVQIFYTSLASYNQAERFKPYETGIKTFVHTSWLITRDIKLGFDAGFKAGLAFKEIKGSLFRPLVGIGLTVKF
ncbi:hypothetical protein [Treponema pedis]|uniref:Uncharacterized protein n=1 Tax=Treponema pedis TaxID=409322 RepID=A0A7S6WNP9_9SPIR|nr:hypothetical protein [Treponema pedis]QOW60447.1 hypothetical protein IFE08_11605 [Treponema pedis]